MRLVSPRTHRPGRTSRLRRLTGLAVTATALTTVLGACQVHQTMWAACTPDVDGNPFGADASYVLVCRGGRWEPIMTIEEHLRIRRGEPVTIAALPSPPGASAPAPAPAPAPTPAPSGYVSVSSGAEHTCGLTAAGGVRCWGDNSNGQLGDGTTTDRLTPVDVVGLSSGVAQISSGSYHTCAVTTGGAARCWGANGGRLGDGTFASRTTPVDVVGLSSGVARISSGGGSTCAVTTAGGATCWGDNSNGLLGDGTTTLRLTPVDVSGLGSGVAQISAGDYHTCAVTTGGAAKCWGLNANGRLGDGTTTERRTPVDVSGLGSGVAQISAGVYHTCAVTTGGAAECWGNDGDGQLGDGATADRLTPAVVPGSGSGIAQISSGRFHTCALTTAGAARCWGDNAQGQLGDGTTVGRLSPVGVSGAGSGIARISSGGLHTCALTTAGAARCWGDNAQGQLGDGTIVGRLTPVSVG